MQPIFNRVGMVTGAPALDALTRTRVLLLGVGGVGSWCAEALIRSGVGHLTMVDSDLVCITNVNRQVQATPATVGEVKVEALRRRLLEINPRADIVALQKIYQRDTADQFDLSAFDYIIDAIDSLGAKVDLIERCFREGHTIFSAMGASAKIDPTRIRVGSLWEVENCRLGRFVRKRLRRRKAQGDLLCVHGDERLEVHPSAIGCGSGACLCPQQARGSGADGVVVHEWCSSKKQINGSLVHITGIFGFMLAGLVIQDVVARHPPVTDSADSPPKQGLT